MTQTYLLGLALLMQTIHCCALDVDVQAKVIGEDLQTCDPLVIDVSVANRGIDGFAAVPISFNDRTLTVSIRKNGEETWKPVVDLFGPPDIRCEKVFQPGTTTFVHKVLGWEVVTTVEQSNTVWRPGVILVDDGRYDVLVGVHIMRVNPGGGSIKLVASYTNVIGINVQPRKETNANALAEALSDRATYSLITGKGFFDKNDEAKSMELARNMKGGIAKTLLEVGILEGRLSRKESLAKVLPDLNRLVEAQPALGDIIRMRIASRLHMENREEECLDVLQGVMRPSDWAKQHRERLERERDSRVRGKAGGR